MWYHVLKIYFSRFKKKRQTFSKGKVLDVYGETNKELSRLALKLFKV